MSIYARNEKLKSCGHLNMKVAECETLYAKLCEFELNKNEFGRYQKCKEMLEENNGYKEQGSYIHSRSEFHRKK